MGVFKNIKKRYIAIISVCVVIVVSCGVYIGITLWPKEEKAPEPTKSDQSNEQQEQNTNDGPLYEVLSCEELVQITGEPCNNTETPTPPTYTPNYTTPTSDQPQTPAQYDVPNVEPTPTYTPSCSEYHQKYYSEYTSKSSSIRSSYNNKISSASMSCNGQGGCPAVTNLKRQLDQEIATIKSQYKSNMTSVGCDPSQYVDF